MKNKRHNYTLVEMLMVMVISAVIVVIGAKAVSRLTSNSGVDLGASTLRVGIEQAQTLAVTSRQPVALLLDYLGENNKSRPAFRLCFVKKDGSDFKFTGYPESSQWRSLGDSVVITGAAKESRPSPPDFNGTAEVKLFKITNLENTTSATMQGLVFNNTGSLSSDGKQAFVLLAEGVMTGNQLVYTKRDPNNPQKPGNQVYLTINPFTGNTSVATMTN